MAKAEEQLGSANGELLGAFKSWAGVTGEVRLGAGAGGAACLPLPDWGADAARLRLHISSISSISSVGSISNFRSRGAGCRGAGCKAAESIATSLAHA